MNIEINTVAYKDDGVRIRIDGESVPSFALLEAAKNTAYKLGWKAGNIEGIREGVERALKQGDSNGA